MGRLRLPLEKIISGGQTGADRGGLSAAIRLGIAHGGWCPRGRRSEDGVIPARYRMNETKSRAYHVRTRRNVEAADATVLITRGRPSAGCALTARVARELGKPLLLLDLEALTRNPDATAADLRRWLASHGVRVLNVAGDRESDAPGIQRAVGRFLVTALKKRSSALAQIAP